MRNFSLGPLRRSEISLYRQLTFRQLGILFPEDYLLGSDIRVIRGAAGEILGGYAIVLRGPYRVIQSIPSNVRQTLALAPDERAAEVTALWMDSQVRGTGVSARLWLCLWWDLVRCPRTEFYFAYTSADARLERLYRQFNRRVIFAGLTRILPGMRCAEIETVALVAKRAIVLLPFLRTRFLIARFLGRADNVFARLLRRALAR